MKNGITFTTVINTDQFQAGIWDPYHYRSIDDGAKLSDFIEIERVVTRSNANVLPFDVIEYKDIPKGSIIGFNLKNQVEEYTDNLKLPVVPEDTILFGTMRAYLGNVLVTPKSNWLSKSNCWFAINSEFVVIKPKDNLNYFWWAFLKSPVFLSTLPTGTGGTRPRSNAEQLGSTPVLIPDISERIKINAILQQMAERYWVENIVLQNILNNSGLY
jgi:restriction endonuclease S subunit